MSYQTIIVEIEDGQGMSLDEQLLRAGEVGVVGVVQAGGDIESSRWSAWAASPRPIRWSV